MAIVAKKKLSNDELSNVEGGAVYITQHIIDDASYLTIEVIDDTTGNVVKVFDNDLLGAYRYCKNNGYSEDVLSWPELKKLRDDYNSSH